MPIVTFTSDFGTVDGYVGAMKGVVLSFAPDATLADITHDIPRHDVAAGAFALAQAAPLFPAGTIHLAVVDPGVGAGRADLIVEMHGQYYVGPDNGLLSLAARGPRAAWRIENTLFRREPVSPTFHGRDVFAVTAGRLAAGTPAREAGPTVPAIVDLVDLARPGAGETTDTSAEGVIVHIDAFGNLITSFPGEMLLPGTWLFEDPARERVIAARAGRTYGDVAPGELVAYVGSAGLVEIAVREGSASALTGFARGGRLRALREGA